MIIQFYWRKNHKVSKRPKNISIKVFFISLTYCLSSPIWWWLMIKALSSILSNIFLFLLKKGNGMRCTYYFSGRTLNCTMYWTKFQNLITIWMVENWTSGCIIHIPLPSSHLFEKKITRLTTAVEMSVKKILWKIHMSQAQGQTEQILPKFLKLLSISVEYCKIYFCLLKHF